MAAWQTSPIILAGLPRAGGGAGAVLKWLNRDLVTGPYLGLALSEKDFHKALKHCAIPREKWPEWIKTDQADATVHFFTNQASKLCAVVCLRMRDGIEGIQVASMLVHDAVHIWQEFRDHIGETNPSREFEAYSIQSISQRLMYAYAESVK